MTSIGLNRSRYFIYNYPAVILLQLEHNHFSELGCRGLVIVRNPFKALISHRHLDIGGHTGYAPKSQFQGPGETLVGLVLIVYQSQGPGETLVGFVLIVYQSQGPGGTLVCFVLIVYQSQGSGGR